MKKTLSIIALSIIGFGLVSCKKENKETQAADAVATDSTATTTSPADSSTTVAPVSAETPAAPVSNQPLTTIALAESNFDFGKVKKEIKYSMYMKLQIRVPIH